MHAGFFGVPESLRASNLISRRVRQQSFKKRLVCSSLRNMIMQPRNDMAEYAIEIYRATLREARADRLIDPFLASVASRVANSKRVLIAGAGKASVAMAEGCVRKFGGKIEDGLVITKDESDLEKKFSVVKGGHPIPTDESLRHGEEMMQFAATRRPGDFVIFCLSGGASALMESLHSNISLSDLRSFTSRMLAEGVEINEINRQRIERSRIKGGGLAEAFGKTSVVCFVLSDIADGETQLVGSGPLISPHFPIEHIVIGDHRTARALAVHHATTMGLSPVELDLRGEAKDIGAHIARTLAPGMCIVATGEPVVTLRGAGLGGRCQEMALAAAIELAGVHKVAVLCGSTDGTDGPTEFAGGLIDGESVEIARKLGIDAKACLANNASSDFLASCGGLVSTGATGTNLNDIVIAIRT